MSRGMAYKVAIYVVSATIIGQKLTLSLLAMYLDYSLPGWFVTSDFLRKGMYRHSIYN